MINQTTHYNFTLDVVLSPGAYYYYKTQPGKDYEATIMDMRLFSIERGIPYR